MLLLLEKNIGSKPSTGEKKSAFPRQHLEVFSKGFFEWINPTVVKV